MPTDKLQGFLQIDMIILGVCGQACSNYPKWQVCYFLQYLKKGVNDEVDFLQAYKHENLLHIDAMVLIGMVKHSQSSQNSEFAMSLQYLSFLQVDFNTLGTKVSYRVILSLLMGMNKHSQTTQSKKFAISLQYLKE